MKYPLRMPTVLDAPYFCGNIKFFSELVTNERRNCEVLPLTG